MSAAKKSTPDPATEAANTNVELPNVTGGEAANTNVEAPELSTEAANTNVEIPKVADKIAGNVAETVELPARPRPIVPKMRTFELLPKAGLDSRIVEKLTSDMQADVRALTRSILEGKVTDMEIPTLSDIDADKALNRKFSITVGQTIIASLGKSSEHKRLRKAISKAGSASDIMMVVDSYSGTDKTDIDNLFSEAVLAMYGLMMPDKVLAKLKACELEIAGKKVTLEAEMTTLLGKPVNTNHAPGQVLNKILADEAMLLQADPARAARLVKIIEECRKGRIINAKSEDPVLKAVIAEISTFSDELGKAQSILGDAAIVAEVDAADEADRKEKTTALETKLTAAKAELDNVSGEIDAVDSWLKANSRPATPADRVEFERRQSLRNRLAKQEAAINTRISDFNQSINKLSSAPAEGSRQQKVELAKAKAAFVAKIETFAAHIQRRIDQLAKKNVVVDMATYPKLKAFLDSVAAMTATNASEKVKYLEASLGTALNTLEIQKELGGFVLAISDNRDYNEEELALTFLTAKYVDLGYTTQQAEMVAMIEYTKRERNVPIAQFMIKANEEKEKAMDGRLKRIWNEKFKGSIEYITAERGMKLCSRNPRAEVEQTESEALEALMGKNDYVSVRRYLLEGRISRNGLTTFMYELMSLVGGRQIDDGTFMKLKTAGDIGKIENMVLNINKFLAEDSALEIISRTEELAATPEGRDLARAEVLAKSLRAYNDEIANTEILLATRAFTSDSSILTKAKIKAGVKAILEQIDASGMTKEQFMQELQRHGINGLENGFALNRFRMNQVGRILMKGGTVVWNGTQWVGSKTKNGLVTAYANKGKAARAVGNTLLWPIKAPFRLAGWAVGKVSSLVGSVVNGITTGTIRLMAGVSGVVITAVGVPYGLYKSAEVGAKDALAYNNAIFNAETGKISQRTSEKVAKYTKQPEAANTNTESDDDSEQKAA